MDENLQHIPIPEIGDANLGHWPRHLSLRGGNLWRWWRWQFRWWTTFCNCSFNLTNHLSNWIYVFVYLSNLVKHRVKYKICILPSIHPIISSCRHNQIIHDISINKIEVKFFKSWCFKWCICAVQHVSNWWVELLFYIEDCHCNYGFLMLRTAHNQIIDVLTYNKTELSCVLLIMVSLGHVILGCYKLNQLHSG